MTLELLSNFIKAENNYKIPSELTKDKHKEHVPLIKLFICILCAI